VNKEIITEVDREVKRFVERLEAVKKSDDYKGNGFFHGSSETAALKRSSLDLTKSLAKLRK
jgi:hypothetical protein